MKLAYIYNPKIEPARLLAEKLAAKYGEVPEAEADVLVAIGGDGSVLCALPLANGRKVYGVKPPGSNSTAFTLNEYDENTDLIAAIEAAPAFDIHPVVADIEYLDGTHREITAYNCVNLTHDSGQAAMLDLSDSFNGGARSRHIIGNGLVFATPMGSTGLNLSCGGKVEPMDAGPRLIVTGEAIGQPRPFPSESFGADKTFGINCITSHGKRPLRLDFDGNSLRPENPDNPFSKISVKLAEKPAAQLAVWPRTPAI